MAGCLGSFLRGLWSLLINSLRVILFLLCLVMVITLSLFILGLNHFDMDLNLALPGAISGSHYFYAVALLAIALLGCCGSFMAHNTSLRAFAILCIIYTLFLILGGIQSNLRPADVKEANKNFEHRMKAFEPQYEWFNLDKDAPSAEEVATRAWDALQSSLMCCGLHHPEDWNKWRPEAVDDNLYPASCCSDLRLDSNKPQTVTRKNAFCAKNNDALRFHKTGCLEKVEDFEAAYLAAYNFCIVFPILLCALACIVSYLRLSNILDRGRVLTPINLTHQPPHLAYQRVPGDQQIILQAPVSELYKHQAQNQQWIYPNAYSVEQHSSNYNAPPPSYGSTH